MVVPGPLQKLFAVADIPSVGLLFTVIAVVFVSIQPLISIPVTVKLLTGYCDGQTVFPVIAPFPVIVQLFTPVADIVIELPEHAAVELGTIVREGEAFTVKTTAVRKDVELQIFDST